MTRRLLTCAAATAVLAIALVSCADTSDGPRTDPPSTVVSDPGEASSDSAASDAGGETADEASGPDEQDTAIPAPDPADFAGMDENTPEGAEQAFRYYIALVVWGHQTGESDDLGAMQTAACATCSQFVSDIDDLRLRDEFWSGASIEAEEIGTSDSEAFDLIVEYSFILPSHTIPGESREFGSTRLSFST